MYLSLTCPISFANNQEMKLVSMYIFVAEPHLSFNFLLTVKKMLLIMSCLHFLVIGEQF